MPKQTFIITRAPEANPIMAREIEWFLYRTRRDSEWSVEEKYEQEQLCHNMCKKGIRYDKDNIYYKA